MLGSVLVVEVLKSVSGSGPKIDRFVPVSIAAKCKNIVIGREPLRPRGNRCAGAKPAIRSLIESWASQHARADVVAKDLASAAVWSL
jgi:hypothetical protein